MSAGVYTIPSITKGLLHAILEDLQYGRRAVVTIKNYTNQILEKPIVYFSSGASQFGLPTSPVTFNTGLVWGARKTEYAAQGSAGVIVYHMKGLNRTLAFMWCVPLNYLFYSNWWNLKIYDGHIEPDEDFFMKMYYDSPYKGDGNPSNGELSGGWTCEGSMGSAGQCIIDVSFYDNSMKEVSKTGSQS